MAETLPSLPASVPAAARAWLEQSCQAVRGADGAQLPVLFPSLPRRIGREPCAPAWHRGGGILVHLGGLRACDLAAVHLLAAARPGAGTLLDLFLRGDLEERTMVLRSRAFAPVDATTVRLLDEAQRSNMLPVFEAATCDSNLLARAHAWPEFGVEGFNRMLLKVAFLGLPLRRVIEAETHANAELSRMLQDLASEREAAGRAVWPDTYRLIARAPVAGTLARLAGGLEHGADELRMAAAEGALLAGRPELVPFARERLAREPRAEIRAVLERLSH